MNARELATAIEVTKAISDKVDGILSLIWSNEHGPSVLLSQESFAEQSEGYTIEHHMFNGGGFPHQLMFKIYDVEFKTLLTDWEFKKQGWDDYFNPPLADEVFQTSKLTEYERKMKECGHKQSDFF